MITSSQLLFTNNPITVKTIVKSKMVKGVNGSFHKENVVKESKYVNALVNGSIQSVNLKNVKREVKRNQLQSQLVSLGLAKVA